MMSYFRLINQDHTDFVAYNSLLKATRHNRLTLQTYDIPLLIGLLNNGNQPFVALTSITACAAKLFDFHFDDPRLNHSIRLSEWARPQYY